jgi:hypothetical protein
MAAGENWSCSLDRHRRRSNKNSDPTLTGGFNRRTPAKTELFRIGNTKMMPINTATIGLTWVTETGLERRRLSDRGQSPVFARDL